MSKFEIINKMSRTVHKAGFQLKKHSPEILIAAGVAGTVTAAVMACRATTKIRAVMIETEEQLEAIHTCADFGYTLDPETNEKVDYTEADAKKETAIVYAQTAVKMVKLYAPSVALGVLSLTAVVTSNHILRQRNIALAAAYATVDKSFKTYRSRVVERFGEELDKELRYDIKAKEVEVVEVDAKGKEKTVKKTINVAESTDASEYARFFDETCPNWERNNEYNMMFLKTTQNHLNDLLRSRGHLFLNEAYDALGFQRTQAGNIVGWIYDEEVPTGDNYVDFGIFNINDKDKRAFVNGYEKSILLDFNVDGPIIYNL